MNTIKTLEVGDKIEIKNWYHTYIVTITRVTKTKAVAEVKRKDGTSWNESFKREYYDEEHIRPFTYIAFDMTHRRKV